MFVKYNANPIANRAIDCTVRAICTVMNQSWEKTYIGLFLQGFLMYDMPSSNNVWMAYLLNNGFKRKVVFENFTCKDNCYTVRDFCADHPRGEYLISVDEHVIAAVDGNYYDTFDSGDCLPLYYFEREYE